MRRGVGGGLNTRIETAVFLVFFFLTQVRQVEVVFLRTLRNAATRLKWPQPCHFGACRASRLRVLKACSPENFEISSFQKAISIFDKARKKLSSLESGEKFAGTVAMKGETLVKDKWSFFRAEESVLILKYCSHLTHNGTQCAQYITGGHMLQSVN